MIRLEIVMRQNVINTINAHMVPFVDSILTGCVGSFMFFLSHTLASDYKKITRMSEFHIYKHILMTKNYIYYILYIYN